MSDYVTLDIPPYILDALNSALYAAEQNHVPRRERIATAALQGLLSSEAAARAGVTMSPESSAQAAVRVADALIAELAKPVGSPSVTRVDPAPCKNPRCFGGRVDDGRCPDCTSPTMPRFDEP